MLVLTLAILMHTTAAIPTSLHRRVDDTCYKGSLVCCDSNLTSQLISGTLTSVEVRGMLEGLCDAIPQRGFRRRCSRQRVCCKETEGDVIFSSQPFTWPVHTKYKNIGRYQLRLY